MGKKAAGEGTWLDRPRPKARLIRRPAPGLETAIIVEQGRVERMAQSLQNAGQAAPPAQLEPEEPGLGKNELHHLAQQGRERVRAPGEAPPGALQAAAFLFGGWRERQAIGFGIEVLLDFWG